MARFDQPDHDRYWGSLPIALDGRDLPRLKAEFLVASLPARGRVLEVGCGGGRLLQTLAAARPGLELHGVDIRPLRAPATTFDFRLVDAGDTQLPYDTGSFDAVIMFDFLEHLADPGAHLVEARRLLRPNGRLVSFTPLEGNRFSAYRMFRRLLGDDLYAETKDHQQAFSEEELDALVSRSFVILERRYLYHGLGQLMDASLFATLRIRWVQRRYSEGNPYYRDESDEGVGPLATLMRAANLIAYAESRALRHVSFCSAGTLFWATPVA